VGEHAWGLAEAKVSAPPEKVWRETLDHLWQAVPSCPAGHVPDLRLELGERLWRDAPLAPVIRDAEPQEFTLQRLEFLPPRTRARGGKNHAERRGVPVRTSTRRKLCPSGKLLGTPSLCSIKPPQQITPL